MSILWIFVPIAVMVLSLVFVDGGAWRRPLGVSLLLAGMAGTFYVVLLHVHAAEEDAAKCASRGGVPANGECWIDGERS